MSKIRKILVGLLALLATVSLTGVPAQAAATPELTISSTGLSLAPSAIANFSDSDVLRLSLTIDSGWIDITPGDSGATVASGASVKGSTVAIVGTQAQLNAALDLAVINQGCASSRHITGSVVPGTDALVYNPTNGHWYQDVSGPAGNWADAKVLADSATLTGGIGHGYLATLTSADENTLVGNAFTDEAYFGGSDSATEGEWFWMDGPEAGTKFYSTGAAVSGQFNSWSSEEPNNSGNEDFGQLWSGNNWNDGIGSDFTAYIVEFGGMPGDDYSNIPHATASATLTTDALMTGAGTAANPYLVVDQASFAGLINCSGAGVYFKQTADITTDVLFTGITGFTGNYDGNHKTIDLTASTSMTSSLFGDIAGATKATDTSVVNLTVTGASLTNFGCSGSLFANSVTFATLDGIQLTNSSASGDCQIGLLAQYVSNSVIKNTDVSGSIVFQTSLYGAGALAASANDSQFLNDSCSVSISNGNAPFMHMLMNVGGCVGRSSSSNYTRVSSSGSFTYSSNNNLMIVMHMNEMGGLIGSCSNDTITESSSSFGMDFSSMTRPVPATGFGGLVGMANSTNITRSFATGTVNVPMAQAIGGLVGYVYQTNIANSYATGAVTGQTNVGSLGGNLQSSTVADSYATGVVTVSQADGSHGLIGYSDNHSVTNSFWKINPAGVASTVESFGQEAPKYSGDLKKPSTFAGWNISATPSSANDWAICPDANGGYPYLAWQTVATGCTRSFITGATASVSGISYVGGTVTAVPANWDILATLSYQWMYGSTPIPQATSATFTPAAGDAGKILSVRVTGAKDGYISSVVDSSGVVVAAAPNTKVTVIGGFAKNSNVASKLTKASVTAMLKNVGTVFSLKCDAFATGKKLTPAQKKLANARAAAVCALITAAKSSPTITLKNSVAVKSDKIKEGVRVTVVSLLP